MWNHSNKWKAFQHVPNWTKTVIWTKWWWKLCLTSYCCPYWGNPLGAEMWNFQPTGIQYLTPSDFHLFGSLKAAFRGQWFTDEVQLKEAAHDWLYTQPKKLFLMALESSWTPRQSVLRRRQTRQKNDTPVTFYTQFMCGKIVSVETSESHWRIMVHYNVIVSSCR